MSKPTLKLALSFTAMAMTTATFNRFLDYVEARPGVTFVDPVLARLPAHNVTWIIFGIIYPAILLALFLLSRDQRQLQRAFQAYTILTLSRIFAMTVMPLAPPPDMIVLRDPVVEFFGSERVLTKDLFFSGHTSLLFLFGCLMPEPAWKRIYLTAAALIGALVLVQHVHYTVDVLAAPAFAYASYRLASKISS